MEDSSFGRLVGAIASPNKTFASIAKRPTWALPFFVLMLLAIALTTIMVPKMDMEEAVRASLEDSSQSMSEAEIEQAVAIGAKFGWVGSVVAIVFQPIVYLIVALVLMVAFKLAGGEIDFRTSWAASLHGWMPMALMTIVMIPVVMGMSEVSAEAVQSGQLLRSNLGFLAPEGAKALRAVLSSLDFFGLWTVATMSIAFRHAAKVTLATSATVVTCLWAVVVLGKVGFALIF